MGRAMVKGRRRIVVKELGGSIGSMSGRRVIWLMRRVMLRAIGNGWVVHFVVLISGGQKFNVDMAGHEHLGTAFKV